MKNDSIILLDRLNKEYYKLHKAYEDLFWVTYMGEHKLVSKRNKALKERDAFRANTKIYGEVCDHYTKNSGEIKTRLGYWKGFFERYQTPWEVLNLKDTIAKLESKIETNFAKRKEGYIDPKTKKFVEASSLKMSMISRTHSDEAMRKACFIAREKLDIEQIDNYVELVKLRNEYAKKLGFEDFYAFKLQNEEGMTKNELFTLFDDIYDKTKYAFKNIRALEKKMPGLRKPWNFSYMMAGDFTKEDDPYFQFSEAVERWGKSFSAMGIDFKKGSITLDLLDRKGKYNNGFCHWPGLVTFEGNKRIPGISNFTCNLVAGQIGSGIQGLTTLFHEGGHAAHLLNSQMKDVCINHEYAPMSTAWAEVQSMFLDTVMSGIEWKTRYAKNSDGKSYPFELYERKVRKLNILSPLDLNGISSVCELERKIYELKNPTADAIKKLAVQVKNKYDDLSEDSYRLLGVPHLYSWESACSYHGYGLAELGLTQWRKYFFDKYGYIVDNPNIGKEMEAVWKLGASKTFPEMIKLATKKKLSSKAFIQTITRGVDEMLKVSKKRIKKLESIKINRNKVNLNATIRLVHGKKLIADSSNGFESMVKKYSIWLKGEEMKNKTS